MKMIRSRRVAIASLILGIAWARIGAAQHKASEMLSTPPTDSAAIVAAAVKADTGRMMPGYRDLSRYNSPGYCLAAMRRLTYTVWRRGELDTAEDVASKDTIPTLARQTGRECLSKIKPEAVLPQEQYNLLRLALSVGDTSFATRVLQRQLASVKDSRRERGFVIADMIQAAIHEAHPTPLAFAERWLSYFDTLGSEGLEPALPAYATVLNAATVAFDTASMVRIIDRRAAYMQPFSDKELEANQTLPGIAYNDSIVLAKFEWYNSPGYVDKLRGLIERFLGKYRDEPFAQALLMASLARASLIGTKFPTLSGIGWYTSYPSEKPGPRPGRITLIIPYGDMALRGNLDRRLATLRRLYNRYHDQGLDIILVTKTQGYRWMSPPLDPEKEAKVLGWYFRTYLQLPFSILVEETPFQRIPDGRRVDGVTKYEQQWGSGHALIGRDGVTIVALPDGNEAWQDAYIRRELARPDSSSPASASASSPSPPPPAPKS